MENLEITTSKSIFFQDLESIFTSLSLLEREKFKDSQILITGCAGFLGFYLLNFLSHYKDKLKINKIIGIDNFLIGSPNWLNNLKNNGSIEFFKFDIVKDDIRNIPGVDNINYVIHMASIASPTFYRKFPLETIDANVWGLRSLLDFYSTKNLKGLLFFSSSEIYGNPDKNFIPTKEDYLGYVSCQGPRACYDEAKRFGETLCYIFNEKFGMPISIVRPFNNYGPGMKLNDARAPADFANAIVNSKDITLFSDGQPTRTFCYITDALSGYLKALLLGKFETFNIGNPYPEITISDLAFLYQKHGSVVFNYKGKVSFNVSNDTNYLINNPLRRCPSIEKAKKILDYDPKVSINDGVFRFLTFLKQSKSEDLTW